MLAEGSAFGAGGSGAGPSSSGAGAGATPLSVEPLTPQPAAAAQQSGTSQQHFFRPNRSSRQLSNGRRHGLHFGW